MFVRHRTTLVIVLPLLVGSLLACPSKKPATVGSSSTSNPSVATTRLPACIRGFVLEGAPGAPRPSPPIPTPSVSPQSGTKGARVTISGSGMAPNVSVDIVAFYGGDNCLIKGPGDEFLGVTRSNGTGAYAFSTRWPTNFRPYAGRGSFGTVALPKGDYYIVALPCDPECKDLWAQGSDPGGPFTLR